ncbi:hypothetical protein J2Z22_002826 [Paenibacillus forsythiae]|uniref:Uncharacterized protein n=1 Tax=Paenibacillus forsythiae TaxID=365616 RepID=A0ABU3HC59_9BACL|nr:hypothetical protein [Paenibacillus forsythiae]MDT3427275.1 hypothetical protein [Paenibacillus forsythiae]
MKKYQKTVIAGLSTMAILLTPIQAAFADEAVTNSTPAQEVQASNGIATTQGTIYGLVGDPTTDIYMNGVVTVGVTAPSGGNFVVYAIDQYGSYIYLGEIIGSGTIHTQLYGYHKIYVSSSFSGTFYVTY